MPDNTILFYNDYIEALKRLGCQINILEPFGMGELGIYYEWLLPSSDSFEVCLHNDRLYDYSNDLEMVKLLINKSSYTP